MPASFHHPSSKAAQCGEPSYVWRAGQARRLGMILRAAGERLGGRVLENGWYIPSDRLFPMGDNRDDSRDARYFGAVRMQKVLGRALFRYWPLTRLGGVH